MWYDEEKPRDYEYVAQIDIARGYKGLIVDFLKKTSKKNDIFFTKKIFWNISRVFLNFFILMKERTSSMTVDKVVYNVDI